MQKRNRKDTYGKDNIIKSIENIYLKCIRIGRKGMWIKPVQFGENMVDGLGSRILTSIKNIMHGIEKKFLKRNMISIKKKETIINYENRAR